MILRSRKIKNNIKEIKIKYFQRKIDVKKGNSS